MKRILFVTQRDCFPFQIGGAGISAHSLLNYLTARGHKCLALGVLGKGFDEIKSRIDVLEKEHTQFKFITNYTRLGNYEIPKDCHLVLNFGYEAKLTMLYNFDKFFASEAINFKPDLVITQMMGSGLAVKFSFNQGIPCAHLIRDVDTIYNLEPLFLEEKYLNYSDIFSNSKFVQQNFLKKYKRKSLVLYPSIKTDNYLLDNKDPKYITFVNPHTRKGLEIFIKIAEKMLEYKFLVVEGWGKTPKTSPINNMKNVTVMPNQLDMREVYKMTRILIVPSVWQEAFARVVIEAQTSGIPVIAGKHSGLIESVGSGGILLDEYLDADSWIKVINDLQVDNAKYKLLSNRAVENAKKFDIANTTNDFCEKYGL